MTVTLTIIEGPQAGRVFTFDRHDTFLIGRSADAHYSVPEDPYFSRMHFLIEVNPPFCRLIDFKSRNRTFVNGRPIHTVDLQDGDLIKAGQTVLQLSTSPGSFGPELLPPAPRKWTASSIEPDDLVEDQAGAWRHGLCPRVEDYLREYPSLMEREESLLDLICGEYELRSHKGERPTPREYESRFPELAGAIRLALEDADGPSTNSSVTFAPPEIPGYEIHASLGKGGMGVVYKASRLSDGIEVALKAIRPAMSPNGPALDRFLREARILQKLEHPNIVRFHEMGEAAGLFYFAMELVPGIDAAKLLQRNGPLPIARALDIMVPVLEALNFAHERGYIHRDVKPGNVLVYLKEGRESAKLADFGLGRAYQESSFSGLTMSETSAGTPQYMPPEQVTDFKKVQPPADQYSAAATLYYLLTGLPIYEAANSNQLFRKILLEDPIPIRLRNPEIPQDFAETLHRALTRKPKDRYPSVQAFVHALKRFERPAQGSA